MPLDHIDISKMLEVAIVAARLAGQRAMEEIKYVKSSIKNGREIVTQADPLCQEIIINRIKETYPDHGFIGEEGPGGKMLLQPPRTADPIWWVIDPIDGTNNYAHGFLCFGVSIGAMYKGEPVVGVIFDPATESMYTAAKGADAQLNSSRINVSDEDATEFASFGLDSHFEPHQSEPINKIMQTMKYRNIGTTALQMAYVAKGSLIGTLTTVTKLWDIAAGAVLIEAAGGIVTDLAGKKIFPLEPESYDGENFVLLGCNKKTHQKFLEMFGGK